MGASMRIWVDDIRLPPEPSWIWCKTSAEALTILNNLHDSPSKDIILFSTWSLDHDLGGDDTTRPIVLWFCENDWWPREVRVHSANPVGIEWLEGMIKRYKNG